MVDTTVVTTEAPRAALTEPDEIIEEAAVREISPETGTVAHRHLLIAFGGPLLFTGHPGIARVPEPLAGAA